MEQIAIEDIATVFAGEFVKEAKSQLQYTWGGNKTEIAHIPFLKMSHARRRKIVEKVLDKMLGDAK